MFTKYMPDTPQQTYNGDGLTLSIEAVMAAFEGEIADIAKKHGLEPKAVKTLNSTLDILNSFSEEERNTELNAGYKKAMDSMNRLRNDIIIKLGGKEIDYDKVVDDLQKVKDAFFGQKPRVYHPY